METVSLLQSSAPAPCIEAVFLPHCIPFETVVEISWLYHVYFCLWILYSSPLFHMSLCKYYPVFIAGAL